MLIYNRDMKNTEQGGLLTNPVFYAVIGSLGFFSYWFLVLADFFLNEQFRTIIGQFAVRYITTILVLTFIISLIGISVVSKSGASKNMKIFYEIMFVFYLASSGAMLIITLMIMNAFSEFT